MEGVTNQLARVRLDSRGALVATTAACGAVGGRTATVPTWVDCPDCRAETARNGTPRVEREGGVIETKKQRRSPVARRRRK